jgi:plastocyanin
MRTQWLSILVLATALVGYGCSDDEGTTASPDSGARTDSGSNGGNNGGGDGDGDGDGDGNQDPDSGGGNDGSTGGTDAGTDAPTGDSATNPPAVESVSCNGVTPAVTVSNTGFNFNPANPSMNAGEILRFQPNGNHDFASRANSPAQFRSGNLGQTGCLKFNVAGTYPFKCTPHEGMGMVGTLTVR